MQRQRMIGLGVLCAASLLYACSHGASAQTAEGEGETGAQGQAAQAGDESESMARARQAPTRENGQKVADDIMAQWRREHPDQDWVAEQHEKHVINEPADNTDVIGEGQGATYGRITAQDVETWKREVRKLVADGSRIFHSADALQSPIAVSCDMCHPDASNTHPETYPKFQVQMGRVAHLRDMINWCIEHPVRGPRLEPDSAEMRALEAYILAQRKGTELNFGRR